MQRAHEVLHYVGLGEARYRNIETYSTGMKQRIKLAQALVHDPDLLFLDEPTNGMDPKGRDEMLELVRDLAHNKGVNLILSSHLLPDVEHTCDHVVVMDKGRVAAQGPIDELKRPRGRVFELRVKGDRPGRSSTRCAPAGLECTRHRRRRDAGVRARATARAPRHCSRWPRRRRAGASPAAERADAGGRLREAPSAKRGGRCPSMIRAYRRYAVAAARRAAVPGRSSRGRAS